MGVTIANQLICLEDATLPIRDNPPVTEYCLSQELQSATNLEQSLENFVAGEILNDYKWDERDGAALRTMKRQCVGGLQDVLAVHLKRFRMNWETWTTEKVNKRFEFPMELDMFPYTKEGLAWKAAQEAAETGSALGDLSKAQEPAGRAAALGQDDDAGESEDEDEREDKDADAGQNESVDPSDGPLPRPRSYYLFRLAGVVVHSGGSLNSGHYYSFICSRQGSAVGEWFEFNDSRVSKFDVTKLPEQTFGGSRLHSTQSLGSRTWSVDSSPNVNNAYMLFYERVEPQEKSDSWFLEAVRSASIRSNIAARAARALSTHSPLQAPLLKGLVPPAVFSRVQEDNACAGHRAPRLLLPVLCLFGAAGPRGTGIRDALQRHCHLDARRVRSRGKVKWRRGLCAPAGAVPCAAS